MLCDLISNFTATKRSYFLQKLKQFCYRKNEQCKNIALNLKLQIMPDIITTLFGPTKERPAAGAAILI